MEGYKTWLYFTDLWSSKKEGCCMHNQLLDSQKGHTNMHLHEGEIWLKWSCNNLADKFVALDRIWHQWMTNIYC